MDYPFRNLVFEGGGVKGIAYIGAMNVLEQKGILKNITRVGGASAGAINALLFALGYTPEETRTILWSLDFSRFEDGSFILWNIVRVFRKYGWFKGNFFREWIADRVEEKTNSRDTTFADLAQKGFRKLWMVGTNLSTGYSEVYSGEHTPQMRVVDAVRISMSIPLFFKAVRRQGNVLVDGGVLDNYPVKLFDEERYLEKEVKRQHSFVPPYYRKANRTLGQVPPGRYVYNRETLGFRLDSREEIEVFWDHEPPKPQPIKNFGDYAKGLVRTMLESQENQHLHSDDWQRTIYIDTLGVKTTQFDLDDATKNKLVDSGVKGTKRYFKWYDDRKNNPVNRVKQ